jgi:hypothetical protein
MGWSSNITVVLANLARKADQVDEAVGRSADKGKIIGVQEIQNRAPVDTGNLKGSYPRCSTVTKPSQGVRQIEFTSDVDYQPDQEFGNSRQPGTPHLRPGVAAAMPKIGKILKEELER